jgi:hypothetical protein
MAWIPAGWKLPFNREMHKLKLHDISRGLGRGMVEFTMIV